MTMLFSSPPPPPPQAVTANGRAIASATAPATRNEKDDMLVFLSPGR
jgi:hypothetical protein